MDVSSLYKLFTLYASIAGGECKERFVYSQASSQAVKERERERELQLQTSCTSIYSLYNDGNLRNAIHTHVEEIYTNTQGFLEI